MPTECGALRQFQQQASLYITKNGKTYLNLSEAKRRKVIKKFQAKLKKYNELKAEQYLKTLPSFDSLIEFEDEVIKDNKVLLELMQKVYNIEVEKIRPNSEIKDIYYNACSNCMFFDLDRCMLNNKKIKPIPTVDNFLTPANTECPDWPPRWTTSETEEKPEKLL